MNLVGRIPPKTCWDYIEKISKSPEKEILVLRFGPQNNDEVKDFLLVPEASEASEGDFVFLCEV